MLTFSSLLAPISSAWSPPELPLFSPPPGPSTHHHEHPASLPPPLPFFWFVDIFIHLHTIFVIPSFVLAILFPSPITTTDY